MYEEICLVQNAPKCWGIGSNRNLSKLIMEYPTELEKCLKIRSFKSLRLRRSVASASLDPAGGDSLERNRSTRTLESSSRLKKSLSRSLISEISWAHDDANTYTNTTTVINQMSVRVNTKNIRHWVRCFFSDGDQMETYDLTCRLRAGKQAGTRVGGSMNVKISRLICELVKNGQGGVGTGFYAALLYNERKGKRNRKNHTLQVRNCAHLSIECQSLLEFTRITRIYQNLPELTRITKMVETTILI
ncbi:hypothetical protein WN51_06476 [Melipona quadrifasciata]|uniref:Uncharacterized protein n=1 Tax=Melipona quadrifasciata TaxID=166423 RepID=A0A0N0BK48_9HYME|nr:hypothetical protein WN51_06476 [Melipona quadrifasciata]